jgi:hypothetical protein
MLIRLRCLQTMHPICLHEHCPMVNFDKHRRSTKVTLQNYRNVLSVASLLHVFNSR